MVIYVCKQMYCDEVLVDANEIFFDPSFKCPNEHEGVIHITEKV